MNYSVVENLSDELLFELYEDVLQAGENNFISLTNGLFNCQCKCKDGYSLKYTCQDTYNGVGYCNQAMPYNWTTQSQCAVRHCTSHGGYRSLCHVS